MACGGGANTPSMVDCVEKGCGPSRKMLALASEGARPNCLGVAEIEPVTVSTALGVSPTHLADETPANALMRRALKTALWHLPILDALVPSTLPAVVAPTRGS